MVKSKYSTSEVNRVDTQLVIGELNTTFLNPPIDETIWLVALNGFLAEGTESFNRIGIKTSNIYIRIDGSIIPYGFTPAVNANVPTKVLFNNCRIIVFMDKQANGTLLSDPTLVLQDINSSVMPAVPYPLNTLTHYNRSSKNRFVFLHDKLYNLFVPNGNTMNWDNPTMVPIKEFIPISDNGFESEYQDNNDPTVFSAITNAYYIMFITDISQNEEMGHRLTGSVRFAYKS